jgi:hypothetical protein
MALPKRRWVELWSSGSACQPFAAACCHHHWNVKRDARQHGVAIELRVSHRPKQAVGIFRVTNMSIKNLPKKNANRLGTTSIWRLLESRNMQLASRMKIVAVIALAVLSAGIAI